MGCKESPLLAIIRVYTFEKRALYVDQHYISVPYGRYVDDAYIIASSLEEAECMFNQISEMDPDNRLQWEIATCHLYRSFARKYEWRILTSIISFTENLRRRT